MCHSVFIILYLFILCDACFIYANCTISTEKFSESLTRFRRQASCGPGLLKCMSGECISEYSFCNGKEDCDDGSDEVSEGCSNDPCNTPFVFRCDYGACINKQGRCDGKKDCKDNSDEKNCTNISHCREKEFQCKNGQCIDDTKLCNGTPECPDNSDETEEACKSFDCPISTYTCKYGACVSRKAKCNGIRECFDGSDEWCPTPQHPPQIPSTEMITPEIITEEVIPVGSCRVPEPPLFGIYAFGEDTTRPTIGSPVSPYTALILKCNDRYKQTPPASSLFLCSGGFWTPPLTRACLLACDSIESTHTTLINCVFKGLTVDCKDPVDGVIAFITCAESYEEHTLQLNSVRTCSNGSWNGTFPECYRKPTTPLPSKLPAMFEIITTAAPPSMDACVVPDDTQFGSYTIGSARQKFKPGTYVDEYSTLVLECTHNRYKPTPPGDNTSVCRRAQWSPPPKTCALTCDSVESSNTTIVSCKFRQKTLDSCNDPVDEVEATISCTQFHEELGLTLNPLRRCNNGGWDNSFPKCIPICGKKRAFVTPSITGADSSGSVYPWHVGIYNASNKESLCGGSIITERTIISAGHCFADLSNGNLFSEKNYLVAAGKYYRIYEDIRDTNAQYSEIHRIHIPEIYKGEISKYAADIAVVILKSTLIFSIDVQPVCVDWANGFEDQQIFENNTGVIVGWGQTKEGRDPADELKELFLPVIPYGPCYKKVPKDFRTYVTYDKICGGYLKEGKAVCGGDSGGGLVFEHTNDHYYLRGIVSTSPATRQGFCDSNQYGTYTRISIHMDFIKTFKDVL